MQALNSFNIPKELSCSDRVHPPLTCHLDLRADIFHFCHGWPGGRVLAAPERNSPAPPHQNTPVQRCSHTSTDRPHLQSSQVTQSDCCGPSEALDWILFSFKEAKKSAYKPTFNVVSPIAELQSEDVIDGPVGVQRVGVPVVADESMLASQNQHGSVDQFQSEQFIVTWQRKSTQMMMFRWRRGPERRVHPCLGYTWGVTDRQQLAVLLGAEVFSIISFERHLVADPLHWKYGACRPTFKGGIKKKNLTQWIIMNMNNNKNNKKRNNNTINNNHPRHIKDAERQIKHTHTSYSLWLGSDLTHTSVAVLWMPPWATKAQ